MKKHIPNLLTCLNLLTGALGCIEIIQGNYHMAIYYVIIAGALDFMDGFVARLLKVQSAIGKELDSLADMISFGLLPALYMFRAIGQTNISPDYLAYSGLIIAAFSAIRLAKFNIDTRQSDQFIGVPTPANTIMITSLSFLPAGYLTSGYAFIAISLVSSYLLIMEVPMIALKFKGTSWVANQWKYILIILILLLLATLQLTAIPIIIPAYILLSIAGNYSSKKAV